MASNQINHLSSFEKQLKSALKQYHAPETLGDESPLASYYFLGHLLTEADDASSAIKRGQLLQRELRLAADQLWTRPALQTEDDVKRAIKELSKKPDSDCYAYLILELRCFYRFIKPKRTSEIWENILPGSRAEHYRDYDRAIAKLARVFLQRIHPTFRLEQPAGTAALLGYSGQQQDAAAALAERKAVYLYGPGGTGKTALGALLAEAYPSERRFWFTIRPTFNDRLESLLFALGYFFHQHGASNLWHMLLINEGKVDNPELALGLVHEDLALIQDRSLLLCFDELEQLQVFDPERINPAHQQIVHFIENFRGRVALLLLGQRPFMMADSYVELRGLIAPDIARLFAQVGMKLGMDVVDRLAQHTAGNPRLLCLYRLLCEKGESLDLLLQSATPSAELYPLIQRLWNRLGWAERRILQELSVFRSMAPAEHWATEAAAIKRLADQGLLHWHGPGAVALVSAFRTAIYQELLPEAREALHTLAADIRIDRAEYTAAAYHLCRAGDEKGAIQLWYVHMTQEIQRGQAGAALAIFTQISSRHLDERNRNYLAIIRAELQFLRGNVSQGLTLLTEQSWREPSALAVRALGLQGKFQQELGRVDDAVASYSQAEGLVYRLQQQVTEFHYLAGVAFLRQQRKADAHREADLAYYHAHCLSGNVYEGEGDYTAAVAAYQLALELAQRVGDAAHGARAHRLLARVYARQQKFNAAIEQANLAIAFYERMGDRTNQEVMRNLMGSIYLETGAYRNVVDILLPSIAFFRRVNNPHFVAAAAANLAEAYLKLDDLAQAEGYAQEALLLEEPYTYSHAHYTLGLVCQARQDLQRAEEHLQEAARFAQENQDPYLEAFARHALAAIYLAQGRHQERTESLAQATSLAKQMGISFPKKP